MLPVNSVLNRIAQDMELCQQPRCQHGQSVGAYEERDHQQPHAVTDGIHEDDEQTEEAENGGGRRSGRQRLLTDGNRNFEKDTGRN